MTGPVQPTVQRKVSPLELFFDLVFVFAVSQLAHHLLEHLSWRGAAETAVLLVAVFGVWATASFGATLGDIERPRTRLALIVVMGVGLFMNAGIAHAFTDHPWMFVVPLLLIVLGHGVWAAVTAPTPVLRLHFRRMLVWSVVSAPLWVAGAAVDDPHARIWWWAAAALLDLVGVWLAHPLPGRVLHSEHLGFDADHMLERLRLFLILLLGETVLTVGRVISDAPSDVATVVASAGIFVALVCLWATYFAGGEDLVADHVTSTADPIRSVRLAINVAYCVLAGLVAVAVGSDLAIEHPLDEGSARIGLLLFGGTAFYIAAQGWYFHATVRGAWGERYIAAAVVVAAGVAAVWLPPLVSVLVLDAVLLALTAMLIRAHRRVAGGPPPAP